MTHAIIAADLLAHLRGNRWLVQNGYIPKSHAILCDPPYFLGEMTKRFGKDGSAELVRDSFGRGSSPYSAMSKGFMGKTWDGFESVWHFQAWVTEWAEMLLDYVHPGALGLFFGGTRTYHRLAVGLEDAGWEIADCISWVTGQGFPKSLSLEKATDDPKWRGFGSALKPSQEPCVVARAPRGKRTYAALAREFGTGALAIDAARIGTGAITTNGWGVSRQAVYNAGSGLFSRDTLDYRGGEHAGRWPANFALVCTCESDEHAADCPVAVLGAQSGELTSGARSGPNPNATKALADAYQGRWKHTGGASEASTGTAARFFYQAKAAAWEREAGLQGFAKRAQIAVWGDGLNTATKIRTDDQRDNGVSREQRANVHPTVKPIRLAEYLARLILPPVMDEPRRLLVPFAGSGSEMIGALLAGWDVVTGIEREAEYVDLARARVGWWAQFATYDEARAAYEQERKAKPVIIPAPVVIVDEKPAQLGLFEQEAV
jgi:site-specific DNA-methyltransferase (adenine-specific)